MPELKEACGLLLYIMQQHNGGEGNTLTNEQLVELLNSEFSDAPKDNPDVKELYNQLSGGCNSVVSFTDFVKIAGDFYKIHTNMSMLSQGITMIKNIFKHEYARLEGDKKTLTRLELRYMIQREFPDALVDLESIFKDTNGDDVLDFDEFLSVLADFYGMINNE